MDNRLLASLARKGGSTLLEMAVKRWLPDDSAPAAEGPVKKSAKAALAGAALGRIAKRSVPGAIVVGGVLVAKTLYDRRRAGKRGPRA